MQWTDETTIQHQSFTGKEAGRQAGSETGGQAATLSHRQEKTATQAGKAATQEGKAATQPGRQ